MRRQYPHHQQHHHHHHPQHPQAGNVSPISFDTALELDSRIPENLGGGRARGGGGGGSVYMVRGQGENNESVLSEENLRYLPLGIQEVPDNDQMDTINEESYWSPEGKQSKRPYKRDAIDKSMASALKKGMERRDAILSCLKLMGITAFIIDSQHATTTPEIMEHVQRVITFVGKENRTFAPIIFQRCLLYQDKDGLLYNLVLPRFCAGLSSKWQEYVDSFSAFQAILALLVLLRSLPCAQEDEMMGQLKPVYLAVIAGLVLTQEMSLSWTNAVMMVQACPSISACSVTKDSGSDWIKKIAILLLTVSGAATGKVQVVLTILGILLTSGILLANLGARAWYFFQWQPLSYNGPLSTLLAYMTAVVTGFALPLLGHRSASVGGKPAIESIVRLALYIAIAFVITDFDAVQNLIIVGKEGCSQKTVNAFVGVWFSLSMLASLYISSGVVPIRDYPDEEPLLEEDHHSPVGYRVPNLPDFPIDPYCAKRGIKGLSLRIDLSIGVFLAALIGAGVAALAFTGWGETTENGMKTFFEFF